MQLKKMKKNNDLNLPQKPKKSPLKTNMDTKTKTQTEIKTSLKKNIDVVKVKKTSIKNEKKPVIAKKTLNQWPVFNFENKQIGQIVLTNPVWKTELNEQIVHNVIISQQASWRLSTKKTKGRGEVSGGGKKPWRQKGTGRARHGSIRSPIWRGGGVTFGPTGQENYNKKVNRKIFRKALQMIFTNSLTNDKLIFWNDSDFKNPSTRELNNILKTMLLENKKVLFIMDKSKNNLFLSLRNLKKIKAITEIQLNPYDLVNADKILILEELIPTIEKKLIL